MKTIGEVARTLTENKWCMLALSIYMMVSSINLLWRIAKTIRTNSTTYKINGIKREVNNNTFIETTNKLYRILTFRINGDAIIQEIWEDPESHMIIKGEHEYKSKKEMVDLIEHCIKIHKGP